MTSGVTVTKEVGASALEVWRYRLDFQNLPEYNDDVTNLTLEKSGSLIDGVPGEASMYRFTLATAAGIHVVHMEVTEAIEGASVRASMKGTVDANELFEVKDLSKKSCLVTLTLWISLPKEMESAEEAMRENGRIQLQKELDAIEVHFTLPSV